MTNADRILDLLKAMSPAKASNAEIAKSSGIRPHQQVFQITQELLRKGLIKGERVGPEWSFWIGDRGLAPSMTSIVNDEVSTAEGKGVASRSSREFEALARDVMSQQFSSKLEPRMIPGVRKTFDLVSNDLEIVGDAKFYTLVRGIGIPPAKFSVISEYVWLLEKTAANRKFLVFGNDRRVPVFWLERYGSLLIGISFYFLDDAGTPELLNPPQ